MDFALNDEQQMIVKTTRDFVVNELYPHEKEVEETGVLRDDLRKELKAKAIDAGLYAANMPAEVGGAGLDVTEPGRLPDNDPLYNTPNVIITPHMAAEAVDAARREAPRGLLVV